MKKTKILVNTSNEVEALLSQGNQRVDSILALKSQLATLRAYMVANNPQIFANADLTEFYADMAVLQARIDNELAS